MILFVVLLGVTLVGVTVSVLLALRNDSSVGIIGGAGLPTLLFRVRDTLLGRWGLLGLLAFGCLSLSLITSPGGRPRDLRDLDAIDGDEGTGYSGEAWDAFVASGKGQAGRADGNNASGAPEGLPHRFPTGIVILMCMLTRFLLFTVGGVILLIVGIWVRPMLLAGGACLLLSLILSVIQALLLRRAFLRGDLDGTNTPRPGRAPQGKPEPDGKNDPDPKKSPDPSGEKDGEDDPEDSGQPPEA